MTPTPLARPATRYERFLGRTAAMCVHPQTAWRRSPRRERAVLLASYFAAGYTVVIGVLLLL
jgi:hypothetical protein